MMRPPRPCTTPGCPALVEKGPCPAHLKAKRKALDAAKDPASRRLYGTADWKRLRLAVLAESPICVLCSASGIVTPADTIDHVIPHRGDLGLFYDRSNLRALCKRCHDGVTARAVFHGLDTPSPPTPAAPAAETDWSKAF